MSSFFKTLKFVIFISFCLCANALGTDNTYTEFYVQTTGSNLNSGSTVDNTAPDIYVNGEWDSVSRVFTPASGNPSAEVAVGDFASIYVEGMSQTSYVSRITAVSSTTITVSATAIHGSVPTDGVGNRSCRVGGAWSGPSGSAGFPFNFAASTATNIATDPVRVNIKNGTYTINSAITHSIAGPVFFEGYQTTPGDKGTSPIIDGGATGTSYVLLTISAQKNSFDNIVFQNNGNSGSALDLVSISNSGAATIFKRCSFKNATGSGIYNGVCEVVYYECETTNCRTLTGDYASFEVNKTGTLALRLFAHNNNFAGWRTDGGILISNSITANNNAPGGDSTGDENLFAFHNDFFANNGHGYSLGEGSNDQMNCLFINNNFIDNNGYGIYSNVQPTPGPFFHNGFGKGTRANTSGNTQYDRWWLSIGNVDYTNDILPYQDYSTNNFKITHSEAIDAGYGVFTQIAPGYTGPTTAYLSIGAAQ